jgi:tRNA (guanine-N7-)-methyltransferase
MSFSLGRGRDLVSGEFGLRAVDLPPIPDAAAGNPEACRLDPRAWFDDAARPFEIEIGSGKGTFLVQQAEIQPDVNFLGIEWAKEFWAYAADRVRRRGLRHVRVLNADATEFLRWRVPSGIVRVLHLYFSDPWPKTKHHKRRVLQDRFLEDAGRVLVEGGELRIVTDHDGYWSWMEEHFGRWASATGPFERLPFHRPESAGSGEVVGTNFERKYAREGRPFHAAVLRKRGAPG